MDFIPFDRADRTALATHLHQEVSFEGIVVRATAPVPNVKYICLRNVRIARRDDHVRFNEREIIRLDHIWLDISAIKHEKTRVTDEIVAAGTVHQYSRKDGTVSYCIRLDKKGLTEDNVMKALFESIDTIRRHSSNLSISEQKREIDRLITTTEKIVSSGVVWFHDDTIEGFLQKLKNHKQDIVRACGLIVPDNRSGRRHLQKARRQRHSMPLSTKGFASAR